jgi:hypothetical protein
MSEAHDFADLFDKKFAELGIVYMIDDSDPLSAAFEKYAGELMSSWVIYSMMHEAPDAFMMLLNQISKMRRIDIVGMVAMALANQAFNPYGDKIPPELDAIFGVLDEQPSLALIVETFNTLGHDETACLEGETIRFKAA